MKAKSNKQGYNIREAFLYLVFGALTTILSIVLYWVFTRVFGLGYNEANVMSWLCAVTFAYITNKMIVFSDKGNLLKKGLSFYLSRILSLAVEMVVMHVMIEWLSINDLITKTVVQLIVIVLNYVISKFVVFRKDI